MESDSSTPPMSGSKRAHQSSADQAQPSSSSTSTFWSHGGPVVLSATPPVPSSTSSVPASDSNGQKVKITKSMTAQDLEKTQKKKADPMGEPSHGTMDQAIDMVSQGNYVSPATSLGIPPPNSAATITLTCSTSGISIPLSTPRHRIHQSWSKWSSNAVPVPTVPPAASSSPPPFSRPQPSSSAGFISAGLPTTMQNTQYLRGDISKSSTGFNSTPTIITPPPPVLTTPAMPPDWMKYYDDASLSTSPFQQFPVDPKSLEFETIVELLAPAQVISAEKVVNPNLWQRYCNTRKEMIRAKTADLGLLSNLSLDEREAMRSSHVALHYDRHPLLETDAGKYSPNEVILFHCTRNQDHLDKILLQGLDERLSSDTGGLLGKGIYFSDDPEKSIQYDGCAGVILIFAVLLGDCLKVDYLASQAKFVREPEKEKTQMRNFNDHFFDSIISWPQAHNEYVIYNRRQCCPLYMVKYQRSQASSSSNGRDNYSMSRKATPPFAWKQLSEVKPPMPNQDSDGSWPFYAVSVFQKMGNLGQPQPQHTPPAIDDDISYDAEDSVEDTDENDKLAALINLGFFDDAKNRAALKRCYNSLWEAASYLLDSKDSPPPPLPLTTAGASRMTNTKGEPSNASMATVDLPCDNSSVSNNGDPQNQNKERVEETGCIPGRIVNCLLSNTPPTPPPEPLDLEECTICCNKYKSFSHSPLLWKKLECSHKLCLSCFQSIETSGTTMSGVRHTSIRCPFCQGITGIEVGTCPNGRMTVTTNNAICEGYPSCGNIQINYMISGKHSLNRVAYLPNNPEGNEVLKLLQTAWDRRLCFTIGNSVTTGAQNVLVWNIHHKTSRRGGVQAYGYPDPGYLDRVKWELKGYGIE